MLYEFEVFNSIRKVRPFDIVPGAGVNKPLHRADFFFSLPTTNSVEQDLTIPELFLV